MGTEEFDKSKLKKTKVGIIPIDWRVEKVKDIYDEVTRGKVLPKKKIKERKDEKYKYPVYSSQTLDNGLLGYYDQYLFEDALTWTTDGANAGKVSYRPNRFYCTNVSGVLLSEKGYANECMAAILNRHTPRYVSYVGNPKLMNNVMKDILIPVPTWSEQQKIASILSTWYEAIELYTRLLNEYQSKKEGLIEKILSSNLVSNPNWQKVKLSDVLIESKKVSDKNNQYPILTSAASGIYLQSDYFNKQVASSNNKGYKVIQKGQFTYRSMSDTGDFKFNQLLEYENGIVSPAYSVFEVSETINARFMYYAMNSPRFIYELKKVSQGGTRVALRFNQLKKLKIRIPSRKEQDKIAALFDTISDIEVKHLEIIEGLKEQKRGLMQLLLTGKVRV